MSCTLKKNGERLPILLHKNARAGNFNECESLVKLLHKLEISIDVVSEEKNSYGYTSLMSAAGEGHVHVCRLLVTEKANVNYQDEVKKISIPFFFSRFLISLDFFLVGGPSNIYTLCCHPNLSNEKSFLFAFCSEIWKNNAGPKNPVDRGGF